MLGIVLGSRIRIGNRALGAHDPLGEMDMKLYSRVKRNREGRRGYAEATNEDIDLRRCGSGKAPVLVGLSLVSSASVQDCLYLAWIPFPYL